jgi:hypothetical protein
MADQEPRRIEPLAGVPGIPRASSSGSRSMNPIDKWDFTPRPQRRLTQADLERAAAISNDLMAKAQAFRQRLADVLESDPNGAGEGDTSAVPTTVG